MMQAEHNYNIVRTIFGKENIRDVSVDELLIATAKFPYSSLLQLIYSKTLKDRNDNRYPSSVAKTALYFSNPHWLHHQLQDKIDLFVMRQEEPGPPVYPMPAEEKQELIREESLATSDNNGELQEETLSGVATLTETFEEPDIDIQPESVENETQVQEVELTEDFSPEPVELELADAEAKWDTEQVVEANEEPEPEEYEATELVENEQVVGEIKREENNLAEETIFATSHGENFGIPESEYKDEPEEAETTFATDILAEEQLEVEQTPEEEINIYPEFEDYSLAPSNPVDDNLLITKEPAIEEIQVSVMEEEPEILTDAEKGEPEIPEKDILTTGIEEIIPEGELSGIMEIKPESMEKVSAEIYPEVFHDQPEVTIFTEEAVVTEQEQVKEEVSADKVTDIPEQIIPFGNKENQPEQPEPAALSFEPLYTIDYFASQGIKLTSDDENKDQLSSKLKSFTEWLRAMKKIHPEKLKNELDEKTEMNIKTVAEQSNDQNEVLTETMAEILYKQGLIEKSLEVYEKLSLLNPSKSDYFAAKISALKAIGT